ncbi:hypothetical protein DUNSADRAFT_6862 [Dunaliella salina]|uniref:Encoded protein n=1 Tax=Dunaliella salina TaxID=3046 RepID=A0ABQ7FTP5_DUNSA|nr:hypothetical protein DUNSADRAFT_6862 [Dunaliella salina]|eukprot:KAF5825804.1 hypothetical protein DUNSADRAFT_6862 [Dunaliella salina]
MEPMRSRLLPKGAHLAVLRLVSLLPHVLSVCSCVSAFAYMLLINPIQVYTFQVLLADHEVLQDQIVTVEMSNQRLVNSNEQLAAEVAWYRLENEKERRIVRELESDMVELRRFKNEMCAQLETLKAELAEERGRRCVW